MGWFKRLRNNREVEATLSTRNIRFSRHSLPQLNIQLSPLRLVRPQSSGLLLMRPTNGRGGKGVGVWTKTRNSLYPPRGYRALGCSALRLKEECTELLVIAAWNKVARHNNLIWVIYRALATSKDKGRRNSVICLASFSPPCSLFFLSLFLFFPLLSSPSHRSHVFFAGIRRHGERYESTSLVCVWIIKMWQGYLLAGDFRGIPRSEEDCSLEDR